MDDDDPLALLNRVIDRDTIARRDSLGETGDDARHYQVAILMATIMDIDVECVLA